MGATEPIVWDAEAAEWRYDTPAPAEGYERLGHTRCCERPLFVPRDMPWSDTNPWPRGASVILACCDTPGVPKPVQLPAYSGEHVTCRKCGSKAVETEYRVSSDSHMLMRPSGYPPEWLQRRCAVCQARWDEACVTERDAPRDPLKLADLARLPLKPGDTLLVRCRGGADWVPEEDLVRVANGLEEIFPGVQVLAIPVVVDLTIVEREPQHG